MAKLTQADLDAAKKKTLDALKALKEQEAETAQAKKELESTQKQLTKADDALRKQKAEIDSIKAKIKSTKAETKAIDKRLAKEDREADKTYPALRKGGRYLDGNGRIISPGIDRSKGLVPLTRKLPSASDMLDLDPDELLELMQLYGVVEPWEALRQENAMYVARMRNIPNPELFKAQSIALLDTNTKRGVVSLARRTQERYNTLSIIDGNENQLLMRLPDDYDPDRLCEVCADLAGMIGTYSEHMAVGLPGAASCLGGDYCRCSLVGLDEE